MIIQIKKTRTKKKKNREKENEVGIEKVDTKDIRSQDHIRNQVLSPDPDIRDPDQGQGPIIEMAANPPIIPKSSEEKKEKMLL